MKTQIEGRAWVLGDAVDTDALYPGFAMRLPLEEAAQHVLYAVRPGWTEQVRPGDILVAGRNFGLGSSRPVAALLKFLGISALVADEFNSLFYRNSINYGLPAVTAPGIASNVRDGNHVRIDLTTGTVENVDTGYRTTTDPLPTFVLDILAADGLMGKLAADGFIPSTTQ
ncbi:3-isopropylmalate dehydratase [Rhodococcus sp. HM1]|uniref:LeuD/DmdB family oxidoreductase small subunit n=1 Tax=Rhodococcus sp. HM1 TaxID=2937759 RepID=UPI002009EEA0|nr:3-isopropylmalate dehydratase [Rhodococcus sp. HM1]MCK8671554.1 3-isopropylmalate dehydratase [Rhodococcus sp. HM1]